MNAIDFKAIKAATPLSSVVSQHVKLIRSGREWKACCPFHTDKTPSFTVSDEKGFAHCFGCDWHGDLFDFVQAVERRGLREAAERVVQHPVSHGPKPSANDQRNTAAEAQAIWREATPIRGTPADTYLRSRRLICALPDSLRFARLPYGKRGRQYNCLIALVVAADGTATGIQRTYLNDSGTGKAPVPKGHEKLSLGRIRGGALRLAPVAGELIVCEGLEDGLTLQQELGLATWVSAGVGNLKTMQLPSCVRSVIIGADNDESGMSGAAAAAARFRREGRTVRTIYPLSEYDDFNDELRGITA